MVGAIFEMVVLILLCQKELQIPELEFYSHILKTKGIVIAMRSQKSKKGFPEPHRN